VLGHWFGDQRRFGDMVGGLSNTLQLGIHTDRGAYWQARYRTLMFKYSVGFETEPAYPYKHLHELSLDYTNWYRAHQWTGALTLGQDAFGKRFGRLGLSIDLASRQGAGERPDADDAPAAARKDVEYFVDAGTHRSQVYQILTDQLPSSWTPVHTGYHLGVGARRLVGSHNSVGVRLELDRVNSHSLLSLRAVDYEYRLSSRFAAGAFFGVGRYEYGAPAHGWYYGLGFRVRDVLPNWDIGMDWRAYDKLSRNRVVPGDPSFNGTLPRMHFDVDGRSLYISRRF
jgi:hypothetical protein